MNFIKAIQHATIGYGIRRTNWVKEAVLALDNFGELHWMHGEQLRALFGGDMPSSLNLSTEDISANNWVTS